MRIAGVLSAAALLAATALGAGDVKPGAYCPLPKANEKPRCLAPAEEEYTDFFTALDQGEVDDAGMARVEADVAAGSAAENAYLALSSLSYGYLRLAERVAAAPDADPALVARLERWNALLSGAYERSSEDEAYRGALRVAARDIQERAPAARLRCVDADGADTECNSTESVLRGFDAAAGEVGLGGALLRIYRRIVGNEDS